MSLARSQSMAALHQAFKISKGDRVWVVDDKDAYKLFTVKEHDEDNFSVTVFDEAYKTQTVSVDVVFPVNPPHMNGVNDNTELMFLHDPSLLDNIRIRYSKDQIYTYTANILIAVNPYKQLPLYSTETIKEYYGKNLGRLPPHVYAIADRAYRNMRMAKRDQSIVVSGESGAGKTETCKYVMRFMTAVGGSGPVGTLDELEGKILAANPVLEAFGNAKTLRNNNSSRFGKFTEMHFDSAAHVAGASIVTYLLEKSRLVQQAKGERNFHIFYQLLQGASADQKKDLRLPAADATRYLNRSGCYTVETIDDVADFATMQASLTKLGLNAAEQKNVFSVLSALLHMGDIAFALGEEEETKIESDEPTALVAQLFGLDAAALKEKLLTRLMVAGGKGDVFKIPLNPVEAASTRDALAKFVYGKLFDWLVSRINQSIPCVNSSNFIGLLDISGFEIFEQNSFEQLCINFANEKIQQYFNVNILRQEQEIYELEGLRWRKVDYKDNQSIIDLFEGKPSGILSLLDEECIVPKATDKTFAIKVHTAHSNNEFLDKPAYLKKKKRLLEDEAFVVKHFAGEVMYETQGFLAKNNDSLHDDLIQLLSSATNPFVQSLFPKKTEEEEEEKHGQATGGRFKSVGGKFQKQLTVLMEKLQSTNSHFIRCIKPNGVQSPNKFDNASVMQQLQYSGMCVALVLMQAGFPTRIAFDDLYERYAAKLPAFMQKLKPITFCEALLVALDLHGGRDFQMGLTKVFFRAGKLQFLDDLTNDSREAMQSVVGKVKKWLAKKRFHAAGWAVVSINRFGRNIRMIRAVRYWRRWARFMARMVRVWLPCLRNARKRLYSEEVMRKRREEEERIREEERKREEERRAEEERIRREAEEARLKAEEEARLRKEERRRQKEEARRAMEQKIADLSVSHSKLEQFKDLADVLQKELQAERETTAQLNEDLFQLREDVEVKTTEIGSLSDKVAALDRALEVEKATVAETRGALLNEQQSRRNDNEVAAMTLKDTQDKAAQEIATKQTFIEVLSAEKKAVEAKAASDAATAAERIAKLEAQLKEANETIAKRDAKIVTLENDVRELKKKNATQSVKMEKLERERVNLINVAVKCQEAQMKLRHIYGKYTNVNDLVKLVFDDASFATALRGNTHVGVLSKQGGTDTKKWADRHFILNDNFLFYYATKGDKQPKGVVRMDLAKSVESFDLSSLGKQFGIRISMRAGRDYYLNAANEAEREEWIKHLDKATYF